MTTTAIRGVAGNQVNATTCAVTLPAATVSGDCMYAVVGHGAAGVTFTPPSGWTAFASITSTTSMTAAIYKKVADGTDASASRTWTASSSGKWGVNVFVVSGASDHGTVATTSSSSAATNRVALGATSTDRVIEVGVTKGTSPLSWSSYPSGYTNVNTVVQTGGGSMLIDVATSTTDLAGGDDTWVGSGSQNQAIMFSIVPTPSGPAAGSVAEKWPASWYPTSFKVRTKVASATSVRLAYSVNSDMSSPSFVAAQTPDGDGYVTHTATGLTPETKYYYQLMDTPSGGSETAIGTVGSIYTLQTVGVPFGTSLKMVIGGCNITNDATSTAYTNAIAWGFHMGFHSGDFTYSGTTSTLEADHRAKIDAQLTAVPNLKEFVARGGASLYGRSDHDCGVTDNGDSNNSFTAANQQAYLKYFPYDILNDTQVPVTALDQIRNTGRVSFFLIDNRNTDRTAGATTDSSTKTLLGALQKARLKSWLLTNPAPFKVILGDTQWTGTADIVNKQDWWPAYTFERAEIAGVINQAQAQGAHVEYWHGDSHLVGYVTANDNTWGNFPILCAAPFVNTGGGRQTNTFTAFYNASGATVNLYGRVTIADDGKTMTRTFSGWDAASDVQRVSNVEVYTPPNLTAPLLSLM